MQPYKTSCPSWRAMLGLFLAATSDVLTLLSCCYLSPTTRPQGPSAVARGAATLWKISKGHQREEQEQDSFVTFFEEKSRWLKCRPDALLTLLPTSFFSRLLEKMPAAISYLTTLTRFGLSSANQPRREHFVLFFTQKSTQQYR